MDTIEFTYDHLGAKFEVTATYKKDCDDWELYDVCVESPDGHDYYGETKEIFVRKWASIEMKSLAELIEDTAWDKFKGK